MKIGTNNMALGAVHPFTALKFIAAVGVSQVGTALV